MFGNGANASFWKFLSQKDICKWPIDSKFVPKVLSYPSSPWERGWIDRILHGSGATFEIIQFNQEPLWLWFSNLNLVQHGN